MDRTSRIAEEITTDIYVHNSNRYVTITTTQKDLKIEVLFFLFHY